MGLAQFINRVNRLRHKLYNHGLWDKDSIDEMLNAKDFGPKELDMFEACFEEANHGFPS